MAEHPSADPSSSPSPESIFFTWLGKHELGEAPGFEQLCREQGEHAGRLRELHEQWCELDDLRRRFGNSSRLGAEIARFLGPDHLIGVDLDREETQDADFTVKLLGRLATRGASSTRYLTRGEIAAGGMGAILKVWDEDLRRYLAMKVMLAPSSEGLTGEQEQKARRRLARFLEEAQVTGQLDHPGIVPVHEMGLDANGRVYFTMKLVKGRDLKQIFDLTASGKEDWTPLRAVGVLLRVCDAMRYAHDKGVIHRDLKPSNVMVGRYGEVYVMDWGLARILDRRDDKDIRVREPESDGQSAPSVVLTDRGMGATASEDELLHTMDGDVLGTPAYMPPEQANGNIQAMGPHSDVYAVGAMLYHLLAGQMPYVPAGTRCNNYAVWQSVQEGPPRGVREIAPDAPEELVAICEKAMARAIAERYRDMSELAADLAAFLEGRVVHAHETGAWAEARKWVQRNRPLAAALAAALVLLFAGLIANSSLFVRAEAHASEARTNAERARENERLAVEEKAKVLRLSDVKRLQDVRREADELWPVHPDKREAMGEWVEKATALTNNLPLHRATLESLRSKGERDEGSGAWTFGGDDEIQWQHDVLADLVAGLEGFLDPDPFVGAIASVNARLVRASTIEARSFKDPGPAAAWGDAIEAIASSDEYGGLELRPQLGLLPLGRDEDSGLWEFAHLESGAPARRGADGRLRIDAQTGLVLVLLPPGRYRMGAQADRPEGPNFDPQALIDEAPVRELSVRPFFLSKYELTQAQWERLTGRNPSLWSAGTEQAGVAILQTNPLERVSWLDCSEHLAWLGLALPTEAQWEYAVRAGTSTPWSTGAAPSTLNGVCNIADQVGKSNNTIWSEDTQWTDYVDGHAVHAPVGSFQANAFGLHDMQGNVWEWCRDLKAPYDPSVKDAESLPAGPGQGLRSNRGGAYYFPSSYARSSRRYGLDATIALHFLGVRPARELEP